MCGALQKSPNCSCECLFELLPFQVFFGPSLVLALREVPKISEEKIPTN